jgi:D-alanyl-D-alanine endopeptidase (penicillin-binding protein 7)
MVAIGAFVVSLARFSSTFDVEAEPDAAPVLESDARAAAPAFDPPPAEQVPPDESLARVEPEPRPSPRVLSLGDLRPPRRIRSAAAMIYNPATDEVLWASNPLEPRPIASITKVMTALVLLDYQRDLALDVVVSGRDVRRASTTHVRRRERVTLDDLLHLALVASDNAAARAIARASPWGTRGFVDRMNRKAEELGLESTRFVDPSGLDERNVSSPYDVARLIATAMAEPALARILAKPSYRFRTSRRRVAVRNTNRLVRDGAVVRGGKTGYISEAGYCLATIAESPSGTPLAVVVLGARSNTERFAEVRRLVDWVQNQGRSLLVGARAQGES